MDVELILNLVGHGGISAILLYLLLREQDARKRVEDKLIEVLEELTALRQTVQVVANGKRLE